MRIVILTQYFLPEPIDRTRLLANALAQKGHTVTVITGFPNYPGGKVYPGYQIRWRQWEEKAGMRILRVPLYPDHSQSRIRRIANYASFAVAASILGSALCGPADVMWVYHPPLTVGVPAWWISLLRRVPFVYEIQDLWPETLAATGMMPSPRVAMLMNRLAQFVYKRASAITVVAPGFKRNLITKGVPADKIHIIPNWADEEIYRPVPRDQTLADEYGLAGHFNIVFGGNIGTAQALDTVLDTAENLKETCVQFVIIGDGIELPRLKRKAEEYGIKNVLFVGRQPPERMPHFFAWADALLIHLKKDPLFEITIPSKTTAYLACGRPIICAIPGDATQVIQFAGAGVTCPSEDNRALVRAIREMVAMPVEQREAMGQCGRDAFLAHYSRSVLITRYLNLFAQIVDRKTHPEEK